MISPHILTADVALGLMRDTAGALAGAETLDAMLDDCARAVVVWLDAAFARVWTFDPATGTLVLRASAGMYTHLDGGHSRIAMGAYKIGAIAANRRPHLNNDVQHDPAVSDPEWARREGMEAFAGYPLTVGSELVGVFGLFARHPLGDDTLDILGWLADALALGIHRHQMADRVREEEHHLASTLQRSLLPEQIPGIPGARVAVRYAAAADFAEVGGDWYDVVTLPDGSVALSVGDVVGHDTAAAAMMVQLRNATRIYAVDGSSPSAVLGLVDRFMHRTGMDKLATAVQASYVPATRQLTLSRAGHLPPLLIGADRTSRWLEREPGPAVPLGTGFGPQFDEASLVMSEGAVLLLFTDGLVERRYATLDDGLARLQSAVTSAPSLEPEALCDHLLVAMATSERQFDDVAIMALQVR